MQAPITLSSAATTRSAPTRATPRHLLSALPLLAAALAAPLWGRAATKTATTPVEVWKDPNCGGCQDWIDHMQANSFRFTVHDVCNNAVRPRLGLLQQLGSAIPHWSAVT